MLVKVLPEGVQNGEMLRILLFETKAKMAIFDRCNKNLNVNRSCMKF